MKEISGNFIPEQTHDDNHMSVMDCNACIIDKIGLAQAFVASQPYEAPSEPTQSLICGTAFASLSQPYTQGQHIKNNARGEVSWKKM